MLGTRLDGEQRDLVQSAKGAGEALLAIINDILDFSKIQAHKLELEQAPFGLRELVDSSVDILMAPATTKGLQLAAIVDHRTPSTVIGDPTRLRQVLVNLLNNAVKFTAKGSITVRVTPTEREPALLRFSVQDTGVGIAPETQRTLFRAFQQGDSSTTRKFGGTGLGLAICRELATLMGGEIGVESEVGAGSTFWFTVRVRSETLADANDGPPELQNRRVLVLGRRPGVTEGLRERLMALGFAPEQVRLLQGPATIEDTVHAEDRVIVDAESFDGGLPELLVRIAARVGPDGRIAVLEQHLGVRRNPRALVAGVSHLQVATELTSLREWLTSRSDEDGGTPATTGRRLHARVLVADDNPINCRVARTFLERAGCEVTTVGDGHQAIEHLVARACDLVLMDCQMPGLDGLEATRRIRKLESNAGLAKGMPQPLPILALTAAAEAGDKRACSEAGMNGLLGKPFLPRDLLAAVERALAPAKAAAAAPEPLLATRGRILIVDDNVMNQQVVKAIVERAGYETALAENGQLAVDYLASNPCDLVLMDCQMPVLDGWEATRVIREMEELGRLPRESRSPLPILAVTANAMDGDREKCLAAGMNDYLTKPVRQQRLLEAVSRHLEAMRSDPAAADAGP
jgi:CheY-like chemotaxis protein